MLHTLHAMARKRAAAREAISRESDYSLEYRKGQSGFDRFLGIRYISGGCDHDGVDCFGLVKLYYLETFGIVVNLNLVSFWNNFIFVKKGNIRDDDIVFMRGDNFVNHTGIYKRGLILHASNDSMKSVISNYNDMCIAYAAKYRW